MTVLTRATPTSHPAVKTSPFTPGPGGEQHQDHGDDGQRADRHADRDGRTSLIARPMSQLLSNGHRSAEVAGIEPTGRGSPGPLGLKTRGATRPRSPPRA